MIEDKDIQSVIEQILGCQTQKWQVIFAYNIHKLVRKECKERKSWKALDQLITQEENWDQGKELFEAVRVENLSEEEAKEISCLCIGELVCKALSNASWRPGIFDEGSSYLIPTKTIEFSKEFDLPKIEIQVKSVLHSNYATLMRKKRYKGKR